MPFVIQRENSFPINLTKSVEEWKNFLTYFNNLKHQPSLEDIYLLGLSFIEIDFWGQKNMAEYAKTQYLTAWSNYQFVK